jgi:CBS domain-containing protein
VTPELDHIRVQDVMHRSILRCSVEAPLGEVAGIMARHGVHEVAVTSREGSRPIGVVSDLDVVAAAVSGYEPSALQPAATEPVAVSGDESLHRAGQLMSEHGVSHLVVLDPANGHPIGVLSTPDIAAVVTTPIATEISMNRPQNRTEKAIA